jgi:hypothetical protein
MVVSRAQRSIQRPMNSDIARCSGAFLTFCTQHRSIMDECAFVAPRSCNAMFKMLPGTRTFLVASL